MSGASKFVNTGINIDNYFANNSIITLECWVKPSSNVYSGGHGVVFGNYGYNWGILYYPSTQSFSLSMWNTVNGAYSIGSGTNSALLNTWHHVVGIMNKGDSTLKLYLNGVYKGSVSVVGTWKFNSNALCLNSSTGVWWIEQTFSKAAIYNRALSANEVLQHYNEGIYTLKSKEGKYGGCIAVEEATTNLLDQYTTTVGNSTAGYVNKWGVCGYGSTNYSHTIIDGTNPYNISSKIGRLTRTTGTGDYRYEKQSIGSVANRTFTGSIWVKSVGSNTTMQLTIGTADQEMTSATITLNGQWQKITHTKTFSGSRTETSVTMYLFPSAENPVDILLYESQLEEKSFATSFIDGGRVSGKLIYPAVLQNSATISFWLNTKSLRSANGWQHIMALGTYGSATDRVEFVYANDNSGLFEFTIVDGGSTKHRIQTTLRQEFLNTWNYIVGVWNNGTAYLYINGALIGSTTYTNTRNTSHLYIGSYIGLPDTTQAETPNSFYDELRIDKKATSAEEILGWYISQTPFYPRGVQRTIL